MRHVCLTLVLLLGAVAGIGNTANADKKVQPPFESVEQVLAVVPQSVLPDDESGWTDYKLDYVNQILLKETRRKPYRFVFTIENVRADEYHEVTHANDVKSQLFRVHGFPCKITATAYDNQGDIAAVLPTLNSGDKICVEGEIEVAFFMPSPVGPKTLTIDVVARSVRKVKSPTTAPTSPKTAPASP